MTTIVWLFSLLFWVFYTVSGVIFCVVYMRYFKRDQLSCILGKVEPDNDGDFKIGDNKYIFKSGIWVEPILLFMFWPVVLFVTGFCSLVKFSSSGLLSLFLAALTKADKKIPDIIIKRRDAE